MISYLHLLQDKISFIIVIIMFLHVKIKKVKEFDNFCKISLFFIFICCGGVRGRMIVGFTLPMQSVLITSEVVSSNPTHGELYLIRHCVITFVSDLRQVGGFLWVLRFPSPIKLSATI